MQGKKDLEAKIKLRYYKEVINPNLDDKKYFFVLTSSKKKINIAKIRMNSHHLCNETRCWTILKTPWVKRICHLCDTMSIEDESHFLLEWPTYTHIRLQFHNLCYNTYLPNLLICQKYCDLEMFLCKHFEHIIFLQQIK